MRTQMNNTGSLKITPFTGNIGKFFRSPKPVALTDDQKIVTSPETRWVETLSNPKKPSVWTGKGPSFDSDGGNEYWDIPQNFCRVLENGYMTHYKNDTERATEMFRDSRIDETQTFNGSRNHERMHDDWYDDANRSDGKRGRNTKYKDRRLCAQGSGLTRAVNVNF